MVKVYVRNSREIPIPGQPSKVVVECDRHRENAIVWDTKEQAGQACGIFASLDQPSDACNFRNFRVEQISAVQFVVVCESALA
jgi:hypothetical protein